MMTLATTGLLAFLVALNGEPKAEVVISENCHSAERFAATDLAHWVEEISGARLAVVTNAASAPRRAACIYVGTAFAKGTFDADLEKLGDTDGFAIREKDGSVYLFGTKPRASIYATSTLVEENTDLIWARPAEEFGTVFTKNPTLDFKMTDRLELPAFRLHGWNVVAIRRDGATARWVARQRGNLASGSEPKGTEGTLGFMKNTGGHIYWWMAHPNTYFKTNPEFYGYSKLKQARVPETLCLTAPGLIDVAVSNLAERIDADTDTLGIGFRDSWECCQCENCTAPIPLPDGTTLECKSLDAQRDCRYYSTRYWIFVKQLAEKLRVQFPNLRIQGSGYMYCAEPPAVDIPDYMTVDFCPIGDVDGRYSLLDPRQKPTWRNRLLEWKKRYPGHVDFYEYWCSYDAGFAPIRSIGRLKRIRQNLLDLKNELKGTGIEAELTPDTDRGTFSNHDMRSEWDACSVDRWVLTHLIWDPEQEIAPLVKRYMERAYREAAPQMTAFYVQLEKNEYDPDLPPKSRNVYNCKDPMKAYRLLEEAYAVAQHPNAKTMIGRLIGQWKIAREKCGVRTVPKMDKQEHFREPGATCWETSLLLPEFKVPGYFTWGVGGKPKHRTEVKLLTDGDTLFVRAEVELGKGEGDWLYVGITPTEKGAKGLAVKLTVESEGLFKTEKGYVALLSIPLADLKVDPARQTTFPQYYFIRHDGETGEESTSGGAQFGMPSGTVSF